MPDRSRPSRRALLAGAFGLAAVPGVAGCASTTGPALSDGVLSDRFGVDAPRWRMAMPRSGRPRGLVVALHGSGGSSDDAFNLRFADAVEPSRMALVSVDGAPPTGTRGGTEVTPGRWCATS